MGFTETINSIYQTEKKGEVLSIQVNHLDLFSGVGGFSLAAEMVWEKTSTLLPFVRLINFVKKC